MDPTPSNRRQASGFSCQLPIQQTGNVAVSALPPEISQVFVTTKLLHVRIKPTGKLLYIVPQYLTQLLKRHNRAIAHADATAVVVDDVVFEPVAEKPADINHVHLRTSF
ncbi:hypothetical protein A6U85_24090 [Agrobacterium sp. 13-626]|nr:hypothetical protein A6U85_24090 [Agrobacterium sp. 13-626]